MAAAALADTLEVVGGSDCRATVVAFEGESDGWVPGRFVVVPQRRGGFGERLAGAIDDAWERTECPMLLIGMDTPQVTVTDLERAAAALLSPGVDAVLGPADDGGYWLIGLRSPAPGVFERRSDEYGPHRVRSTQTTRNTGVGLHGHSRDSGTWTRFPMPAPSPNWFHTLRSPRPCVPAPILQGSRALPETLVKSSVLRTVDGRTLEWDVDRWMAPADHVDESLLDRTIGPVLDVGCGPGRHVSSLLSRGVEALGIDTSPTAVRLARRRGAPVAHQSIFDAVPDTGRWRCGLLLDGSIGIGGNPESLLRRVSGVLSKRWPAPGGDRAPTAGVRRSPCACRDRRQQWSLVSLVGRVASRRGDAG